jgi:hypothetical protein
VTAPPRCAALALFGVALALIGCNDLRDYRGTWRGERVGDEPVLLVGPLGDDVAELSIDSLDRHGLRGRLMIDGVVDSEIASLAGAEADVLAGMTFDGSPLRVYLGFADMAEGEDALAVISLHEDDRVDLRMLRGGASPLYAIFALGRQ